MTPEPGADVCGAAHVPARCDGALARAFGFLGKRWNGILVGTLQHGSLSFSELRRAVPGISESVLSDRLTELSGVGLVRREVREGPPVSVRYGLTDRGEALVPALQSLAAWATEHLPAEGGPVEHLPTGRRPAERAPADRGPGSGSGSGETRTRAAAGGVGRTGS